MNSQKSSTKSKKITKGQKQSITVFHYYTSILFPQMFKQKKLSQCQGENIKFNKNGIVYNYATEVCSGFLQLSHEAIRQGAKKAYSQSDGIFKNTDHSIFKKKVIKANYLPLYGEVNEQISFTILSKDYNSQEIQNQLSFSEKIPTEDNRFAKNVYLYVVHTCLNVGDNNAEQFQWERFVQKYSFLGGYQKGRQSQPVIKFENIFSYSSSSIKKSHILQKYFQEHISKTSDQSRYQQLLKVQQNIMLKHSKIQQELKIISQNVSFHPSHRRYLLLTPEQKALYVKLKPWAAQQFKRINKSRKVTPEYMQNLICRFMKNQKYRQKQTKEGLTYYFSWDNTMRSKYTLESFRKQLNTNMLVYLGKDKMGRPVIYDTARKMKCSEIKDLDFFLLYQLYFLQVYIVDQMEGYVDQLVAIGDLSNMVSDNTNINYTKNLVLNSQKISFGRHFRIVSVQIDSITYFLYNKFLKFLLPTDFLEILRIFRDDPKEIFEELIQYIPIDILPVNLGGKNQRMIKILSDKDEQEVTKKSKSDK